MQNYEGRSISSYINPRDSVRIFETSTYVFNKYHQIVDESKCLIFRYYIHRLTSFLQSIEKKTVLHGTMKTIELYAVVKHTERNQAELDEVHGTSAPVFKTEWV